MIDALFGTGFRGELPPLYSGICRSINNSVSVVFSADVPSGLDPTSGTSSPNCIKAETTVTFGLPKKGFYINDGPEKTGKVVVKDIGFPETLLKEYCEM